MSLTDNDLQAIKEIIDTAAEDTKQQTAAGFVEVHTKIDSLAVDLNGVKDELKGVKADVDEIKDTVSRIELIQRAEVERVDQHGQAIQTINQTLKLA